MYNYYLYKFSEKRRHIFTFRFFQNYLNFNYKQFASKNPATISKLVFTDSNNLSVIISSFVNIFSEIFTIAMIYASLIWINWKMTVILSFMVTTQAILLLKTFSKKLESGGKKVAFFAQKINRVFHESYMNFKLVKLLSNEEHMINRFYQADSQIIRENVLNKVLQNTPRIFLETMGFIILVGAVMYVVYRISTPEYVIPILSMYALAFYRFMPSITRVMNEYNQITFAKAQIDKSNELMYITEQLGEEKINFKNNITLKNLNFGYEKSKAILSNVFIKINKNQTVALIGESGAGKSTLADILMGFYEIKTGSIEVDETKLTNQNLKSWRNKIGYIPQDIYLFDSTVGKNVAFGRTYDEKKLIKVLKQANIYEFLLTQDEIDTLVGEGGIRVSGGQMQRIAIARALYSDPEILILDEATSSLDHQTEQNIMEEIYSQHKDKTLIIIARRLSKILKCDKVYKVENKSVTQVNKNYLHQEYLKQSEITESKPLIHNQL